MAGPGLAVPEVLELSLILSPARRRAIKQPATSFSTSQNQRCWWVCHSCNSERNFIISFGPVSKAESFRDALKTAHLCTFCFTSWATNIIFTLMKAALLWIFLGKKILFADQYLYIMDNSIICLSSHLLLASGGKIFAWGIAVFYLADFLGINTKGTNQN